MRKYRVLSTNINYEDTFGDANVVFVENIEADSPLEALCKFFGTTIEKQVLYGSNYCDWMKKAYEEKIGATFPGWEIDPKCTEDYDGTFQIVLSQVGEYPHIIIYAEDVTDIEPEYLK